MARSYHPLFLPGIAEISKSKIKKKNLNQKIPCPPGGWIWTNMERAQQGPPMVHMTKFDQIRLKDLGARRVDDRQTHRQTNKPAVTFHPELKGRIKTHEVHFFLGVCVSVCGQSDK